MAKDFRPVDRDQAFLLPPSMREWLPEDHLVWFVLDVIAALDTSAFRVRRARRGTRRAAGSSTAGRAGYHPDMLLGLLIYGYAHGVVSSRRIEALCHTDVAFRVLCAGDVPDHTVIARFRQTHQQAFEGLFAQVLGLCARAGLGQVGTVAIDGSKFAGVATTTANRDRDWFATQARRIAADRTAAAAEADAAEDALFGDARGDELPEKWSDPGGRVARIRECLDQLEAEEAHGREAAAREAAQRAADAEIAVREAASALERARAAHQDKIDRHRRGRELARSGQGPAPRGRPPGPVERADAVRRAVRRLGFARLRQEQRVAAVENTRPVLRNVSDPDSRLLKTRRGWVQGYNVQFAVSADQLVLATKVIQDTNDVTSFVSMSTAAIAAAEQIHRARHPNQQPPEYGGIGLLLADAGYDSHDNLTAPGPGRLIAQGTTRHHSGALRDDPAHGPPPEGSTARQAMDHRLRTPDGHTAYKRRGATVEPGIGNVKKILERIPRRGLTAAQGEINLATSVFNLLKLHRSAATIHC